MGKPGRKAEPTRKTDEEVENPEHPARADDEYEDGDIATPKSDDPGDDDEPL